MRKHCTTDKCLRCAQETKTPGTVYSPWEERQHKTNILIDRQCNVEEACGASGQWTLVPYIISVGWRSEGDRKAFFADLEFNPSLPLKKQHLFLAEIDRNNSLGGMGSRLLFASVFHHTSAWNEAYWHGFYIVLELPGEFSKLSSRNPGCLSHLPVASWALNCRMGQIKKCQSSKVSRL